MTEKLNLYQKMQSVSNEIKNIEKNMTVGNGSYSYKAVSDLDVVLQVNAAETKFKLTSIALKQELVHSEIQQTKDGKFLYLDKVKMTVRIVDLEDINSFIDVEAFGTGLDSGDKGFGKASTYARKYALLNAYKLATGTDPDSDKSKEKDAAQQPDSEKIAVQNFANKDNKYLQSILSNFNVGCFDDLTKDQIKLTYNTLKQKNLI